MNQHSNSISAFFESRHAVKLTFVGVIFVQLLLAFQGFDVCDDGFAATFYQQFFNDADAVEYNFVYWLSGLVGGIWYELFPIGGVLWLRMLAILINTGTMYLTYRLLRPYIKQIFLLSALVMTLFINDFGYLLFYNNHITAFLAVLSMLLLHRGLTGNSLKLIFLSGLLIGLNVFSRIPNLSQFALILVFPLWFGFKGGGFKAMIKPLSSFKLGFLAAFGLVFMVLLILGQFEIMKRAILTLFDLGSTEQSTHNVSDLLGIYVRNYLKIGFYGLLFLAAFISLLKIRPKLTKGPVLLLLLILVFFLSMQWFNTTAIHGFYVLGYIGVFGIRWTSDQKEVHVIAFMALIMQLLLPFGSGGGINSIGYASLWLSLPLFFFLIQLWAEGTPILGQIPKINLGASEPFRVKRLLFIFLLAFGILKVYNWSQKAYFDPGSRINKIHAINSPYAKGVYTGKKRATVLNEVLAELPNYISPNDYLFVYDKTPMLHFLTETRPYMYNSWPWVYDAVTFEKKLSRAQKQRMEFPVVVVQKFETIGRFSDPKPDYLAADLQETYFHNNSIAKSMNSFLDAHNYKLVWTNTYFEIYIP